MTQCKYDGCLEEAWQKRSRGFCIYHSPDNGKDDHTARKVWNEARKRAHNPQGCDFTGWHFPKDPEERWFKGDFFQDAADFREAIFQGDDNFSGATFYGHAGFAGASFQGHRLVRE